MPAPCKPVVVDMGDPVPNQAAASVRGAKGRAWPFAHWLLDDVLPPPALATLLAWDPGTESHGGDTGGRRDARNGRRVFVTPETRCDPGLDLLARTFDATEARDAIAARCGARLDGTALRLELCLDTDGFWLEPHTDIGAKKLTLLVSLSTGAEAADWGTDLMTPEGRPVARASGTFNSGLMFVPGEESWHGFTLRPIHGLRRSLIVNFVSPEWRTTGELAFGPAS